MINILVESDINGVKKYAIASCSIVGKDINKLASVQRNLSFPDNPVSLQVLSEVLKRPAYFNYNIGDMFYANNILLTHFFDKYRLRSSSKYVGITDQAIIDSFSKSFSNDVQFAELCSRLTDLVIFSESILPYIDFNRQFLTNWMPEYIISRVGIAYNDAKANTDLLNLSMEILKRRQNSNSNDGISR